jgi:uncharacterized SAM-dependent methyltransferase
MMAETGFLGWKMIVPDASCTWDPALVRLQSGEDAIFLTAFSWSDNWYLGNFTQAEAVDFLKQFSDVMKPQDLILIGVDSWNQPDKV